MSFSGLSRQAGRPPGAGIYREQIVSVENIAYSFLRIFIPPFLVYGIMIAWCLNLVKSRILTAQYKKSNLLGCYSGGKSRSSCFFVNTSEWQFVATMVYANVSDPCTTCKTLNLENTEFGGLFLSTTVFPAWNLDSFAGQAFLCLEISVSLKNGCPHFSQAPKIDIPFMAHITSWIYIK